MNLCQCGCGEKCTKQFVKGHNKRLLNRAPDGKRICPGCKVSYPPTTEFFVSSKTRRLGLHAYCKQCQVRKGVSWMKKNYDRLRPRLTAKRRHDWATRPEFFREKQRRSNRKLKLEMIAAYGGVCSCCGEAEPDFLTLEHVNRNGKQHRAEFGNSNAMWRHLKRLGWPKDGYTVYCWNCNCATSRGQVCPHQRSKPHLVIDNVG